MSEKLLSRTVGQPAVTANLVSDRSILAILALALVVLGLMFRTEIKAAVNVWDASTAYSHCYLVLPMAGYLIWERRHILRQHTISPNLRWCALAIPITVIWLVAERLGFMEGRQLALIAGVEVMLLAVLGRRLFTAMLGPLLFLIFLVPFGAFLTPALQQFTAAFSIAGLRLLGIPHYSDNFIIETPAGVFFVAEACAGLRFLIAAVAFGVFYALLTYTSYVRRGVFILASIIIPIVANGFRALGIIVLGQMLGSAEAAAVDHLVYGWVFFSAVMLLLIAIGQMFRDDPVTAVSTNADVSNRSVWSVSRAALATIVLTGVGPAVAALIDTRAMPSTLADVDVLAMPPGCQSSSRGTLVGASERRSAFICDGIGIEAQVTLFAPRSTYSPVVSARRASTAELSAEDVTVSAIQTPAGTGAWTLLQMTAPNRVVAYASWINGAPVTSGIAGRVAQARNSVLGSDHAPALITVTASEPAQAAPELRKAVVKTVTTFLQAQTGLDDRVAASSRNSLR